MTRLDPRAARCDLTSRECCKLLCAALSGVLAGGLSLAILRRLFRLSHAMMQGQTDNAAEAIADMEVDIAQGITMHASVAIFAALVSGLQEQAAPNALREAFDWIAEQSDDFWAALDNARFQPLPTDEASN